MGEFSKIEWTDHTFNPWIGCTKVSDGCKFCYAEQLMDHRYHKVEWGPTGTRQRTSVANWRKPLQWDKRAAVERRRYRVFCASLADVFEDRPELYSWREELFGLIDKTPNLDWLLLTKRPENVERMVLEITAGYLGLANFGNVWLGTSVENQEQADRRIPHLMAIRAKVRFLSMEPLLGPVDLWSARYSNPNGGLTGAVTSWDNGINWVIVGGESGKNSRPMYAEWAQAIKRDCEGAGVPFFFKQGSAANWSDYKNFDSFGKLAIRQLPSISF
jgi:protein gp37